MVSKSHMIEKDGKTYIISISFYEVVETCYNVSIYDDDYCDPVFDQDCKTEAEAWQLFNQLTA